MVFQNPNAKIIYPESGKYSEKLNYISNKNFNSFEYKISFTLNDTEVITYADIGTTINTNSKSIIIYVGTGNINTLFDECRYPDSVLICADALPEAPKHKISSCIISGSDENKKKIATFLKQQNIDYKAVGSKTISIKF